MEARRYARKRHLWLEARVKTSFCLLRPPPRQCPLRHGVPEGDLVGVAPHHELGYA